MPSSPGPARGVARRPDGVAEPGAPGRCHESQVAGESAVLVSAPGGTDARPASALDLRHAAMVTS
ncbi:hypothetical protein L083_2852 [Actinoplanes sp. N902-109]|nr:hypothetical protein L083_2852 [Actinoplanes sp. N902-109]